MALNQSSVNSLHSHFNLLHEHLPADWTYAIIKDEYLADIVGVSVAVFSAHMPHQEGWRARTSMGLYEHAELVGLLTLVKTSIIEILETRLEELLK